MFSGPVSTLTFGSDKHAAAVALLSLAVFFGLVSAGQGALIQGMRRISDLAQMGVLGALSRHDHQHPPGVFPSAKTGWCHPS